MLNKASLKSICIYATSPLMWDWYPFEPEKMVHCICIEYLASVEKQSHQGLYSTMYILLL